MTSATVTYPASEPVDLVVLSRAGELLRDEVRAGITAQRDVCTHLHRVTGEPRPDDPHRWATIARARNEGKRLGSAPWVMFLDDDVALEPGSLGRLVEGLKRRPNYGALAADYLGQSSPCRAGLFSGALPSRHVGMGATLFRRTALSLVRFRWEPRKCECQCCCDDLRNLGLAIDYLPAARARHLAQTPSPESAPMTAVEAQKTPPPRILAAFDRRHYEPFRRRFLGSLRASGNDEWVTAVAYGLYPTERRILEHLPRVEVVPLPVNGILAPIRRLRDFQLVLARWPGNTPVAYWDAGDVLFQGKLGPLWELARAHPEQLLAVREPKAHPANTAVARWTLSIRDPVARRHAYELLTSRPFLNSGFSAGAAATLLQYFREADRLLHSAALQGTSDWGDQTVLNFYCHSNPNGWHEAPEAWNYCTLDRKLGEFRVTPEGRVVAPGRAPIVVAHGHARSLRQFEISRRFV